MGDLNQNDGMMRVTISFVYRDLGGDQASLDAFLVGHFMAEKIKLLLLHFQSGHFARHFPFHH